MDKKAYKKIKEDFSWAKQDKQVLSVLLFGSVADGKEHRRSDVDIAVVVPVLSNFYYDCKKLTHKSVDSSDVLRKVFREVNTVAGNYDVHIFEELPLYIQIDIINNHEIVYTADKLSMFEYFYHYRKLWDDQKHRNIMSKDALFSLF